MRMLRQNLEIDQFQFFILIPLLSCYVTYESEGVSEISFNFLRQILAFHQDLC
jgi:hypothetical protein